MAAIPVVLLAASTAVAAYGAYAQGQAASASYKSQAQADTYNAQVNAQNANQAGQEANAREETQRMRARAFMGQQRAAIGENLGGFGGTAAGVIAQSGTQAELDALNERYAGQTQASGLLAQAALDRYQSAGARMNAGNALRGGYLSGASSLLSGASSYYSGRKI